MENQEYKFNLGHNEVKEVNGLTVVLVDDPEEYEKIHTEKGAGSLTGEALRSLKPAFNAEDGLYIFRPTFEQVEGYDEDYLNWIVDHERTEFNLDAKAKTGNDEGLAELHELGFPNKQEDEEAFFRAIHDFALSQEIDTAISTGKAEAYLRYLEKYLKVIDSKINQGDIEVSDEDLERFKQRQAERLRLIRERLDAIED